jgi:toxin ParE1/3/4
MKVFWIPRAVEDLKEVARYIGKDNPRTARLFADRLKRRAESLVRFPKRGKIVPEFSRDELREIIQGNYRIVYRLRENALDILAIFEAHRLLQPIKPEE